MSQKNKNKQKPQEEVNVPFIPETVDEGLVRTEAKQTPMDLIESTVKVRKEGNWKKVSREELGTLESKGLLEGYDPENEEALIREE